MAIVRTLLGLAISVACIAALLTQIDLQLTWSALTRARPAILLLGVAILIVTMLAKAQRWRLLYYPTRGLRFGNLASALFIGYMVSALIPLRLGEVVRAYLIGRTEPVAFTRSVGTLLVEKLLDVITLLCFLAILGLCVPLPTLAVPGPLLAALGLGGLAVLFGMAWLPRARILAGLTRIQRMMPMGRQLDLPALVGPFLDALAILRYPSLLGPLAAWSGLIWLTTVINAYVLMWGFELSVPVAAAVFLVVVTNLGMVVPSAPGYVGVFHYLTVLALVAFAVEPSEAMAYAVGLHALTYGSMIAVGLFCLWRGGYHWNDLWASRALPSGTATAEMVVATSTRSRA